MLSVITPVFNRTDNLPTILDEVDRLSQHIPCELILVDDGSKNSTKDYLGSLHSQRFVVKKVFLENNSGPGHARNRGLEEASKKYVTFLDSDDVIRLGAACLADLRALLATSVDIVRLEKNEKKIDRSSETLSSCGTELAVVNLNDRRQYFGERELVECWGYLIKRALLEEHKIRFLPNRIVEDQPFIVEVFLRATTFSETRALIYFHAAHSLGASKAIGPSVVRDHISAIDYLARLLPQIPQSKHQTLLGKICFLKLFLAWYSLPYPHLFTTVDHKLQINESKMSAARSEIFDSRYKLARVQHTGLKMMVDELSEFLGAQEGKLYLYGLSVISISLIEVLRRNRMRISGIIDDKIEDEGFRGIPILKLPDLERLLSNEQMYKLKSWMLVAQLETNIGMGCAERAYDVCGGLLDEIWVLDGAFDLSPYRVEGVKKL